MDFIWTADAIDGGLHIFKPQKNITGLIGWNGVSDPKEGGRWTIVETNTDGMINGKWLDDDDGNSVKRDGELVWTNYTKEELADFMNSQEDRHKWFPASLFDKYGNLNRGIKSAKALGHDS